VIGAFVALIMVIPGCYLPPVNAPIVDPFRLPACAFCSGNRGLEYLPTPGATVIAAASGVVRFSGLVAGVRYLVIDQTDGRAATYGRLAITRVMLGASVAQGDVLATTTERFFFGLREGRRYVDPEPFLGRARYRPRLVPNGNWPRRRAPPPVMVCSRWATSAAADSIANRPSSLVAHYNMSASAAVASAPEV
jgi:hypothetical protein